MVMGRMTPPFPENCRLGVPDEACAGEKSLSLLSGLPCPLGTPALQDYPVTHRALWTCGGKQGGGPRQPREAGSPVWLRWGVWGVRAEGSPPPGCVFLEACPVLSFPAAM